MYSRDKNIQAFCEYTEKQANKLGVKIMMSKDKFLSLSDSIKCSGYFDSDGEIPTLAVATGRGSKFWITILVHESCHMEQWAEDSYLWQQTNTMYKIDEWLTGKEFPKEEIDEAINSARSLELDCEKRAVKKIRKWKLPISKEEYIQKSNAYILFYNYMKKVRKWSTPERSPYRSKKIYTFMPDKFLRNYSKLPKYAEEIFDKQLKLI